MGCVYVMKVGARKSNLPLNISTFIRTVDDAFKTMLRLVLRTEN